MGFCPIFNYHKLLKKLAGTTGLEPATSCVTGCRGKAISLILRHGWHPQVTENHVRNAQVVPILYSFGYDFSRLNPGYILLWSKRSFGSKSLPHKSTEPQFMRRPFC